MTDALILGIDIGTGSAKGVLADTAGTFFSAASRTYHYTSPVPCAAEQDPEEWWQAVCGVCHELLESIPDAKDRIRGVAISGQGVAAVVLDRDFNVVRPAMLWMDTRATNQAADIDASCGEEIAHVSGKGPAAYNTEPKLLWIRDNEPENWKKIAHVLTTTGYINHRLTGCAVLNHSDAGVLLGYDLAARAWSMSSLHAMQLDPHIFPDLADSFSVIGTITAAASRECGLPQGVPVVAGGEDTSSAGLAMGVFAEGDVQLSVGTACTVFVPHREPQPDRRQLAFPHVLPELTLMGGSMVCGGISIEWLMKLLGFEHTAGDARSVELAALSAEATQVAAGADGLLFLPYLAGELQPINDGFARGVFFGLTLTTGRAHMLRAVMEGTAYAVRHNLDVARERGAQLCQIIAVGGPSRNDLWCQVMSDINNLPVRAMDDRAGSAFGDAILAAMGVGLITDPLPMQRAHTRSRKEFAPSPSTQATYAETYSIYRELYPRLQDLFPRLHLL